MNRIFVRPTLENLITLTTQLTGKVPTPEEIEEMRETLSSISITTTTKSDGPPGQPRRLTPEQEIQEEPQEGH